MNSIPSLSKLIFSLSIIFYCCTTASAQCPIGQSLDTYCYDNGEVDQVAFEVCPTAGMAIESNIIQGSFFIPTNDNLTVYSGLSGSATSGTIVFGPMSGNLAGNTMSSLGADQCLIFVTNSNLFDLQISCADDFELELQVCSQDITAPAVNFIAPPDLCVDEGIQSGLSGGIPIGGVYDGPGVTDDGNGMTYSFDPAAAGVGVWTLTYTFGGDVASDDIEVFNTPSFTALADLCIDAGIQTGLSGGLPIGGVYSGPGVTDDGNGMTYTFNPAVAGLGVHTITYSLSGICSVAPTDDVEVIAACGCPIGQTSFFHCNSGIENNLVLFEMCPTAGMFAKTTILSGTYTITGNTLSVYEGPSGSMTSGLLLFGPATGDLAGEVITGINPDNCLIFVSNSPSGLGCDDGFEVPLSVCGSSIASNVTFTALNDLSVNAGIQSGLSGGLPVGGVYDGPGVTDDGNGLTYSFDPAAAGVGVWTLTYTFGGDVASDEVEVLNLLPPSFSKSFSPDAIGPGGVSTLTFTINNSASITGASNLSFVDNLPAGVTIASPANASVSCSGGTLSAPEGGTTISYSGGAVPGNQSCTIQVDVTSSILFTHTNITGDLTSSSGNSGTATDNLEVTNNLPVFTKSFSPSVVDIGQRTTLTFTIDNSLNSQPLTSIQFEDILPPGMIIANPSNVTTDCFDPLLTPTITAAPGTGLIQYSVFGGNISFPALPAGGICTFSVDVVSNASGTLVNTSSSLMATIGNTNEDCGKASAILNVAIPPEISIQKAFEPNPVPAGGITNLVFTIANTNRDFPATGIAFDDDLDAVLSGLVAIGPSSTGFCGGTLSGTDMLSYSGGTLAPGASCTISIPVQVPANALVGEYPNTTSPVTATIDGQTVVGNMASENLYITNAPILTKEFIDDPALPGDQVTLRFTITNTDPNNTITNVEFSDDLNSAIVGLAANGLVAAGGLDPEPVNDLCGMGSVLSIPDPNETLPSPPFPNLPPDPSILIFSGGELAAGASCSFDVLLDIPLGTPPGAYTNMTSEITGEIMGETVTGEPAINDLLILSPPILTKEFLDDPVNPGDIVNLEFTISNDGYGTGVLDEDEAAALMATDIAFTDDLNMVLSGLEAVGLPISDVCGLGFMVDGTDVITVSGGSMMPGDVCTFIVPVQVPIDATPGSFNNTTSDLTATINSETIISAPAIDDLDIGRVLFTKEFLDNPVIPGQLTSIRFTIENTTSIDATGISFSDDLNAVIPGLEIEGSLPSGAAACNGTFTGTSSSFNYSNGSVPAGTTCSFDVPIRIPAGAENDTYLNATSNLAVTLEGNTISIDPAVDQIEVSNTRIHLNKEFIDDPVEPGGEVTILFTITNLDPDNTLENISFMDDLGATLPGLMSTMGTLNGICGMGSSISGTSMLSFSGGTLLAGEACQFGVTLQVPATAELGRTYTNTTSIITGEVAGLAVEGDPATDDLMITGLSFIKTIAGPVIPGETTTITYDIVNQDSDNSVFDIAFMDDLDAFIPGVAAINNPQDDICGMGSGVSGDAIITFSRGELGPGEACSFLIEIVVPCGTTPGDYNNITSELTATSSFGSSIVVTPAEDILTVEDGNNLVFPPLDPVCQSSTIISGLGGATPIGGMYSGTGVMDDGNGMTFSFDASITGMFTVTYTVIDENGCTYTADAEIEVLEPPMATFDIGKDFLCEDVGAGATLGGGMPTGGEYSGDGVTDDGNGTTFTYNPPGLGLQTITYTYTDGNGCEVSVDDVIEVFDCDPEITDPCSCLNNATVYDVDAMTGGEDGQFSERVSIVDGQMVGLPPGQTWTVIAASGAYDAFAPLPVPPAQTPLMANLVGETLLDDGMGGYYIDFYHVDDMPYSITVEGPFAQGDPANSVFTIGNHCKYPNPEFDPSVPDDICPTSPVFTFGAIDPDMIGADDVTYELSYEGGPFMMAMDFDPQTMMPGSYLVKMTYDGADDGNGGISPDPGTTSAYPGCIQMIQKTMELREPVNFMSCNDELQASLSSDCTVELIAEMFFEDELFRCYDDYIITVDGVEDPIIRDVGEYSVSIFDPVTSNSCWATVIVEDKLGPVFPMACMQDDPCAYPCYTPVEDIIANAEMIVLGVTDCSEYEIVGPSVVRHPSDDCMEADTLILTYTGIDAMGNQSTKSYYYALLPVNLVNLEFPGNWPGTCNSSRSPEVTGSPTVNGMDFTFDGSTTSQLCDILVGYTDLVIPTCESDCDGSVKIVRDWTVLNWCDSDYRTGTQIIHLKDNEDPTIDPFDPEVASVDPWTCEVERYRLPEMDADDNCTDSLDLKKTIVPPPGITIAQEADGNYYAYNVPKGRHYFEYYAEDCCGNVSLVQPFELNVIDEVAPIAIAKQFSVVSLSNDGLEAGLAKIYAESIDNGSYDRCTDVHLQIRRDGYYATDGSEEDDLDYLDPHKVEDTWDGVTYFNRSLEDNSICNIPVATYPCDHIGNDTYANSADFFGGWNLPAGCNNDVDTDEGQYVKFCCDDLTAIVVDANNDGVMDQNDRGYHKVWLRVWDNADMSVDPDTGAPTYGTDGDYYNETWAYVKVEVSAPPVLTVRDATINCDWPFEEKMEEGYFGSDCSTGELTYTDWMYEYLYWEGICDVQVCIDRWYYASNYDDVCRDGDIYIVYRAKNPDSKGLEVTRTQKITVTNLDRIVCGDIAWPRAFIETDCEGTQMQPDLEWEANACSLIGWTYRSDTFRFESDACVKIINEYTVIDWCLFEETHNVGQGFVDDWGDNNGDDDGWYFEGGHDYFDGLLCSDPYDINTGFWPYDGRQSENGVYKYVEIIKIDDDVPPEMEVQDTMYAITTIECERAIQLEATVTDASDESCPATWFKWEITFDWNRNGIFDDYTYTRDNELAPLRGDVLTFVPYQWWSTSLPRADYIFTGPMETYDVQYIVYDGCGNVDKEVRTVMIVDKKDPTPYCVSLSSAVMENGQVELWARDFDKGSFDNCYSDEELSFTFNEEQPVLSKIGQVHYFKGAGEDATVDEYNEGDAQKWDPAQNSSARIFDCDDVAASPIDVRMTVWDGKVLDGALINWDWCSVELTLIDNQGTCVQQRASISGEVATEQGNEVSEVSVTLDNLSNPEFNLEVMTGNNGMYAFANNPLYVGYDISALKDGDDTEGVSTLDLVLIQRHILGIETFDSPYKMIAADINSDRKITGTDLVVLRKTILDLYHEFPTNTSWRFVEKNQGLTLDNALSQFNEVINISSLDGNLTEEDFVAVKIGDVNATARTNGRSLTQTRSAGTLTVGLEEQQVTEGQTVEVTFSSSDFKEVYGYQFTLELNGLTIESVQAGDAEMTAANIGVLDEHMVTVSYSDMDGLGASDQLFTLTAIATSTGNISEMIDLTSNVINSEGYVGAGLDIHTIEFTINGSEGTTFRLDQNEPNPFDEVTIVGFELPESGNATLTVYDVAGKMVTSLRGTYAQGYNEIKLNKEDLNTTGVLYYTLKSGEFTATKKMIIIE